MFTHTQQFSCNKSIVYYLYSYWNIMPHIAHINRIDRSLYRLKHRYFLLFSLSFFIFRLLEDVRVKIVQFISDEFFANFYLHACDFFFVREIVLENQQKTILLTKYIHICTTHHALHMQTLYIIQNELI